MMPRDDEQERMTVAEARMYFDVWASEHNDPILRKPKGLPRRPPQEEPSR